MVQLTNCTPVSSSLLLKLLNRCGQPQSRQYLTNATAHYFSPAVHTSLLFCTLFELLTDFFTLRSCMLENLYAPLLNTYFIVFCIAWRIKSGRPCAIVVSVCTVDLCKLSMSLHQCHQDKSLYIYLQSTCTAILKKKRCHW